MKSISIGVFSVAAPAASTVPTGRPVRILSLSSENEPLGAICNLIAKEAVKGVDLIILPETWRGQNDMGHGHRTTETFDGRTITAMSALAQKYNTYVVSPIDRANIRRNNSAVLLDRHGNVGSPVANSARSALRQRQRVHQSSDGPVGLSERSEDRFLQTREANRQCIRRKLQWDVPVGVPQHPLFMDMKEATQLIEAWRQESNESRPDASLDDRTPSEFASQYAASRVLATT
jgi:hypothetical protein